MNWMANVLETTQTKCKRLINSKQVTQLQLVEHKCDLTQDGLPKIVTHPQELKAIYQLRFRAWQTRTDMSTAFAHKIFTDCYDKAAIHWAIKEQFKIIASARVSVSHHADELPYGDHITDFLKDYKPPYFMLSRLVVAPESRGMGYSHVLDNIRLKYISTFDCGTVFVVISSPFRIEKLMRYGFQLASDFEALDTFPGGKSTLLAVDREQLICEDS